MHRSDLRAVPVPVRSWHCRFRFRSGSRFQNLTGSGSGPVSILKTTPVLIPVLQTIPVLIPVIKTIPVRFPLLYPIMFDLPIHDVQIITPNYISLGFISRPLQYIETVGIFYINPYIKCENIYHGIKCCFPQLPKGNTRLHLVKPTSFTITTKAIPAPTIIL